MGKPGKGHALPSWSERIAPAKPTRGSEPSQYPQEKKAKAIVEFRKANGLFKQPEDLIKVPGIGPKTLEANISRITVE